MSHFRADIEGLRAVAVVLVVLYHSGVRTAAGGYVGVDVFFVVSGFLITGLLRRELEESGRISLRRFYARRVRRLLPLSAVVLVATVVAGGIVLSPLGAYDLAADAKAAAAYLSNVRFAAEQADYLGAAQAPSPLLHYWSLAVEEQFYLLWPVLLVFARRATWLLVGIVGAASFAACVVLTASVQPFAYFLLPTRAWELAAGAALALAVPTVRRMPVPVAAVAGWTGLAAVIWAVVSYDETTAFPGLAASVPVLGTLAVVAAGVVLPDRGPARLLSVRPLRHIGRWSYAWYLWHWPVLVLAPEALGRPLHVAEALALSALSFWLAAASHYVVENPIRFSVRVPALPLAAALTAVCLVVPFIVVSKLPSLKGTGAVAAPIFFVEPTTTTTASTTTTTTTKPSRASAPATRRTTTTTTAAVAPTPPPPSPLEAALAMRELPANLTPSLSAARADKGPQNGPCHRNLTSTEVDGCVYGKADSPTTVVLFGDSYADHWSGAVLSLAVERGWRLVHLTKSACPPVDAPVYSPERRRPYSECTTWREKAVTRIEEEAADLVVLGTSRSYGTEYGITMYSPEWHAALERMLTRLRIAGASTAVFGATPFWPTSVPSCLSESSDDIQKCARPLTDVVDVDGDKAEAETIRKAGALAISPLPWLCLDRCPVVVGNVLVYRDQGHLTHTVSKALAPKLAAALPST